MRTAKFKISDQEIIDIYLQTKSLRKTAIAAQGITGTATIARKLRSLGVEVKNHLLKPIKATDSELIDMYNSGMSLMEISRAVSGSKGAMQIRKRLQELGIDTSYDKNIHKYQDKMSKAFHHYTLDEHVFDDINTEEKAYWLGMLMADGYNHENKNAVCLRLQSGDCALLEKFSAFLNSNAPIYTFTRTTNVNKLVREYKEVRVNSPYLCSRLAELGCTQGKSRTLEFPVFMPKHLLNHFIRGYFDGDGCISITKRHNRKSADSKLYQFTIVGRENVLLKIQDYLVRNASVKQIPLKSMKGTFIKTIHYGGFNVVLKILDCLYKDATVYLERKHAKYVEMVTRQSNLQK